MNRFSGLAVRGLTVALLSLTLGSVVQADSLLQRQKPQPRHRPLTFEVAGVYTGVVAGHVLIDGLAYRVQPTPLVYQLGVGMVTLDQLPIGTRVYASGYGSAESGLLSTITARPVAENAPNKAGVSLTLQLVPPTSQK